MYNVSIVVGLTVTCNKVQVVTDAIELLEDGFPLDDETKQALNNIGIDYVEFTRRYEIKDE